MANITRKPNGTFLIRVSNGMKNGRQDLVSTIYKPPVGSTSAMARKAAEKYAVLFEELVHSGGYEKKQAISREIRARRRMTIEQFVQDYYYPSIQKHLSPTTCRTYELIIDSLILPSFGRVELEDVDSTHIQSFVDFLSTPEASAKGEHGLSPASVKRYSTVFSSIITEAWKQKFIETNPIGKNYIHYPKIVQPQLEAYSDEEVEQLMEALENEDIRTRALLTLAVTTGMRRGELVGLCGMTLISTSKSSPFPGAFISLREKSKESKPPNPLAVTGRCISPKAVPASYTNSKSNRPATSDTRKGCGWTPVLSLRTSMARISACMRQRESARRCRQNTV